MNQVAQKTAQSATVMLFGLPLLLLTLAGVGWLMSWVYRAFTGHELFPNL